MRKILATLLTVIILLTLIACNKKVTPLNTTDDASKAQTVEKFKWPNSDIAKLLPIPESNIGVIEWEASYGFVINVFETSKEQYDAYVDSCIEKGFSVNYQKGNDYYFADNDDGFHVNISHKDDGQMFIRIDEPDKSNNVESNPSEKPEITKESESSTTEKPEPIVSNSPDNGITPEFKKAMDAYESFFDEYVAFMKKYNDLSDTTSMLADYTKYIAKYSEMYAAMNAINQTELSNADLIYYLEVTARILSKLTEVA